MQDNGTVRTVPGTSGISLFKRSLLFAQEKAEGFS